jgi:hypothetical protein
MSAERGGTAAQDRVPHFQVQPSKPPLAALEETFPGCADHVGHLDRWPRHLLCAVACIALPHEGQRVEWARGSVEALLRKMEVDSGLFQIAMAQENLDGAQIGAVFKQVSGETVSEGLLILLMNRNQQRSAIAFIRSMA